MTWQNFYLFCFLVGFFWSLLSLFVGHLHIHLPFHDGHGVGDFHHGSLHHVGHVSHGDAVHPGGQPHALDHAHPAGSSEQVHAASVSPLNLGTIAAFLAWFGGAGYLLTAYSPLWFVWSLLLSILTGLAGAAVVFCFLAKVLVGRERNLDPADYRMAGVLGYVSSPIREQGTGEIIYSQEGTRRTCGARSEDGKAIAKGTEILVTRYQNGIAYVRLWDELSKSE
jgi:membrane protein implicated in regulation of membrane protease activity